MSGVLFGPIDWDLDRDDEGYRTYRIVHLVVTGINEGPLTALLTPGLPLPGAIWNFGGEIDPFCYCRPNAKVQRHRGAPKNEPGKHWEIEQTFSNKPGKRCQDSSVEDPLLEPEKISGSFVKYTKEATQDRFGNPIKSSSHELFRGQQVEFDHNRPTVQISKNVASLGLDTFSQMIDTVNDSPLWGLPPRRIKLSNVSWERHVYGTCNYYYTRNFEFDINYEGFDKTLLDEGTKVLNGHWGANGWVLDNINGSPPNRNNPQHFVRYKDRNGENARAILDGAGQPWDGEGSVDTGTGTGGSGPGGIYVEYYRESNFLLLGIPTTL